MGVDDKYSQFGQLKDRVITPALEQINEFTDHEIRVSYRKVGRVFRFIAFSFNAKDVKQQKIGDTTTKTEKRPKQAKKGQNERDDKTVDMFTQMTDKQIAMFSRKLAELPELSHFATGEAGRSYEAFAELIASELNNSVKKIKYMPYLEKVGLRGCRGLPMPKMKLCFLQLVISPLWGLGWLLTAHSTKKSCGNGVVKVEIATAFFGNTTLIIPHYPMIKIIL